MKTDNYSAKSFTFRGVGYVSLFVLIIVTVFTLLVPMVFAETLYGKDGWVLFHEDKEGKYYYDESSVSDLGAGIQSAKYIGIYNNIPRDNYFYGFVVEAQASCGLLFNKFKVISLQGFGKGGPDDLNRYFGSAPPQDKFTLPKKGSLAYSFVQAMCKAK